MADNNISNFCFDYDPFSDLSTAAKYLIRGWENRTNEDLDVRRLINEGLSEKSFEEMAPETWTVLMAELMVDDILLDTDIPPLLTYIAARFGMNYEYAEYLLDDFYAGLKLSIRDANETDMVN